MNTNPDDNKLALWLDGELMGAERDEFEDSLRTCPDGEDFFRQRDELRSWQKMLSEALPSSEEPPYPDFFNSRIGAALDAGRAIDGGVRKRMFFWRKLLMPMAVCAGMVLAFLLGARSQPAPVEIDVTGAPKAIPVEPILYTPESGVVAKYLAGAEATATAVILDGVAAIPDDQDFSETVSLPVGEEGDFMAGVEELNVGELAL
jgi:hypothetical protein